MFLNSYRRRLRAAALMRGIVTEKRRFGDESGGSADDQLSGIVSGGGAQCLHPAQPTGNSVPTGAVLVHQPPLACIRERATACKPTFVRFHRRLGHPTTPNDSLRPDGGCPP